MPEPQPAADPADQPGVEDGCLGGVAVRHRQSGEFGGGRLVAGGGEHLNEVARRARQCSGRGAGRGPQVLRRGTAACGERPGAFHRQQRVTVGGADHLLKSVLGQVGDASGHRRELDRRQRAELKLGDASGHRRELDRRQRAELKLGDLDLDVAAGQVSQQRVGGGTVRPVAPGQHEQHGQGGQPPADVRAQLHAGRVGTVHVLSHQEHGSAGPGPLHQTEHRVEQPQPLQLR